MWRNPEFNKFGYFNGEETGSGKGCFLLFRNIGNCCLLVESMKRRSILRIAATDSDLYIMRGNRRTEILDILKKNVQMIGRHLLYFIKWLVLATFVGLVTGLVGAVFFHGLTMVTEIRTRYPRLILGLPVGGLLIVWMYHISRRDHDKGTNMVLSAVREQDTIPVRVAPLIFISTIITHLFGRSAGREGAALQMGGSIGNGIARVLKLDRKDVNCMIMCGMSGAFSALFGTPMAAAVFSMEVVSVGIMYHAALVPCVVSSLVALGIAKALGVHGESFTIHQLPEFELIPALKIILLAVLCAAVSAVFCIILHQFLDFAKKKFKNPYIRVVVGSAVIILLTWLLRTTDYMGAGMPVIERAVEGEVRPEAFLLKMLFTAITLGIGFKGGEIVPALYVGATFGCLMGQLLGISPSLCAAVGMASVFCGVTNAPVSTLLIALELFGMDAFPYMMLGIAISYMLSGYSGLYHSQKIVYSKFRPEINKGKD